MKVGIQEVLVQEQDVQQTLVVLGHYALIQEQEGAKTHCTGNAGPPATAILALGCRLKIHLMPF